jgi:hypothetical protein
VCLERTLYVVYEHATAAKCQQSGVHCLFMLAIVHVQGPQLFKCDFAAGRASLRQVTKLFGCLACRCWWCAGCA